MKRIRVVMMVVMSLGVLTSAVHAKQSRIEYLEHEIDKIEYAMGGAKADSWFYEQPDPEAARIRQREWADRLVRKRSEYKHELELLRAKKQAQRSWYPIIINSYHPQSEPEELYIVEFKAQENASVKTYRMYCPTGMVRDISNGSFKKARKAYIEDRVKYDNRMIIRNVFESVCR